MFKAPEVKASKDLEEHREFIQVMGAIISGKRHISKDDITVWYYSLPQFKSMELYPDLRQVDLGEIHWDESGFLYLTHKDESREYEVIEVSASAQDAIDFLSDVMHHVLSQRRKLAMPANRDMQQRSTSERTPRGAQGNLLREYDTLLDQIKHEHFRQRDKVKGK